MTSSEILRYTDVVTRFSLFALVALGGITLVACGDDTGIAPPRDAGTDTARDADMDAADSGQDASPVDATPTDTPDNTDGGSDADGGDSGLGDAGTDAQMDVGMPPAAPLEQCSWQDSTPLLLLESSISNGSLSVSRSTSDFVVAAVGMQSGQRDMFAIRVPFSGGSINSELVTDNTAATRDPAIAALAANYLALFVDNSAGDFDVNGRTVGFAAGNLGPPVPFQAGAGRTDSPVFSSSLNPSSYFFIRDDVTSRRVFAQAINASGENIGAPIAVLSSETAASRVSVTELADGRYFAAVVSGSGSATSTLLNSSFVEQSTTGLTSDRAAGSVAVVEAGSSILAAFDVISGGAPEVHVRTWESGVLSPIERVLPFGSASGVSAALMTGNRPFLAMSWVDGISVSLHGADGDFLSASEAIPAGAISGAIESIASADGETLLVAWREQDGDVFGARFNCPEPMN